MSVSDESRVNRLQAIYLLGEFAKYFGQTRANEDLSLFVRFKKNFINIRIFSSYFKNNNIIYYNYKYLFNYICIYLLILNLFRHLRKFQSNY